MTDIKTLVVHLSRGRSQRYISAKTGMSRNTVAMYVRRLASSGLDWKALADLPMQELAVYACSEVAEAAGSERYKRLQGQFDYFLGELERTGVTRQLLWQEYRNKDPEAYEYSQFCAHLAAMCRQRNVTMHLEQVHSCRFEVDFAGPQMEVLDEQTGELVAYPMLVGSFRGSSYTVAELLPNRTTECILGALSRWFKEFGGVPEELVTDNLRQMVARSDRYEPVFGEAAQQFAGHYGCELIAARVRKPRDKAVVENGVYQCALKVQAPLRNSVFRSLAEANAAIAQQIQVLNGTPMQRKGVSRDQQFLAMEKNKLQALPKHAFSLRHHRKLKAGKDYHVVFGPKGQFHHYSVPYRLTGKVLDVSYDDQTVWIYDQDRCVAQHLRKYSGGYSTHPEHMPERHQAQLRGWSADFFLDRAATVGPNLCRYMEKTLQSRRRPEHSYKRCAGILSLMGRYDAVHIEKSAEALLQGGYTGYGALKSRLQRHLDVLSREVPVPPNLPRSHSNVRGKEGFFTHLNQP